LRTREGGLQMQTSAHFGKKIFGIFEIYGVFARTRGEGLNQCGHSTGKGEGINFS